LLVGEKLLEKVIGGLDVTGLPDDDTVDGVDGHPTLDDGDQPLVLGAVDDDYGGVRVVVAHEPLDLASHLTVGRDRLPGAGDDGDGRVPKVAGDPKPFEETVDPAVLGVIDADGSHQRLDGRAADDRGVRSGEGFAPVETDDERAHRRTL
jgi:hypothetical protein